MSNLFLSHGTRDEVVPYAASEKTANLMKNLNLDYELFLFDGGHEIPPYLVPKFKIILSKRFDYD